MGCIPTSESAVRMVLPLPIDRINNYVDMYPTIVVYKLLHKFETHCKPLSQQLSFQGFELLYSSLKLPLKTITMLFAFFSNNTSKISFKTFIRKYAQLTKSEPQMFLQVLFEIHKPYVESTALFIEDFQVFLRVWKDCMDQASFNDLIFPIHLNSFIGLLKIVNFQIEKCQKKFVIITEEDIPYERICNELLECENMELVAGEYYYLLSLAWFDRWYYYQGSDMSNAKSTKLVPLGKISKRKYKRASVYSTNSSTHEIINASSLVQQPSSIQFTEIQSQYKGEIKTGIHTGTQCKIITSKMWNLLLSLYPAEQVFKRKAIKSTIELYPKMIYFSKTDDMGQIDFSSQQLIQASLDDTLESLSEVMEKGEIFVYIKEFGKKEWTNVERGKPVGDYSLETHFFMVYTTNPIRFEINSQRREIISENATLGDKVYTYFAYEQKISKALIVGLVDSERVKVHFVGYSFRYETSVERRDLSVSDNYSAQTIVNKSNTTVLKGIANVGNTCFINSVLQCLVATPILDQYLFNTQFDEAKQPILHVLATATKLLLRNQRPNAQQLKKVIDQQIPMFMGYNQHDAQQFLNILLDKMSAESTEKPNVIQSLFGGKSIEKLTCLGCGVVKSKEEPMYILSLPVPESDYFCYNVLVIPARKNPISKILLRLSKDCTVKQFIEQFELRVNGKRRAYVFCEVVYSSLRKLRLELGLPSTQSKKMAQKIFNADKLGSCRIYSCTPTRQQFQERNLDFPTLRTGDCLRSQAQWSICRLVGPQTIEYLNDENAIQTLSLKDYPDHRMTLLASNCTTVNYKKMLLRKYNPTLDKIEVFGIEFLLQVPRWASYSYLMKLVAQHLTNLRTDNDEPLPYIIRCLEINHYECIFCGKVPIYGPNAQSCCEVKDTLLPLYWVSFHKGFWIFIDWKQTKRCESSFCYDIRMDEESKKTELEIQEERVSLGECLNLHQKPQRVEMKCEKCKSEQQHLENRIGSTPNVLVFHLKEFRYTSEGFLNKLDVRLKWQQFMDTSMYSTSLRTKVYELFAFVRHSGNSESGHYTCMAKREHPCQKKKVWVNFDDDTTEIVKDGKNIDNAYLLFYHRMDLPTSAFLDFAIHSKTTTKL